MTWAELFDGRYNDVAAMTRGRFPDGVVSALALIATLLDALRPAPPAGGQGGVAELEANWDVG